MADMFTARPVSAAMGLGLRVPSAGFNADPAMQSGLGSLRPTRADTAVVGTAVPPSPEQSIGGLRAGAAQQVEGLMSLPPLEQRATARPPATVYFNQATNEMFAGDRAFKADDIASARQAAQQPGNTTRPQGQGWTALPEGSFNDYLSSFSERRGTGELLTLGARQVAEGTIGGIGTLMEFGGATEAGPAVREFAQGVFGQDQNEQLRSALIAENSTLMQKIIDGTFQAIPTIASVVAGGGLAGLGARALGAGATGIRAGATLGGAGSTFPMHVSSYYDAAVRNGLDPNDPEIKTEILGGAFANTALDVLGISAASGKIISRALRQTVEESGKKAARSALRNGLTGAALTGFGEGLTETLQTLGETALFDPTVRDQWAAGDWKAMAPYLSETYGDDYLVAAGVGAVLGGGMGGVANFRGTPGPAAPQPEIDQTKPVDLNTTATGQSAEKEAPATLGEVQGLGPVVPNLSPEEAALAANWQSDAVLGPAVPSLGESEQALADQWRSTLGPLQLAPSQRAQPAPAAGTPMGALLLRSDQRVQPAPVAPAAAAPASAPMGQALLTQRQRMDVAPTVPMMAPVAEARPGALLLRPSERAQPAPVAPVAAAPASAPMGRALLTRRQRMDVAPTVSTMAPVVARPDALLLRGNQRAVSEASAEAVGPAASGLQISGVDQAIKSGLANVEVVENGERVPFKNFALSVDGTTAEVGFVERDKGARRGVGYDAYVALGDDLAARGITLQSTPTLQADGRKLWERLVLGGKAHFDAQARRFKFGPAPAPAPTTAPAENIKAKGVETARERARTVALAEARATNKAVAVATKPYKDDPTDPPLHEVALPDGTIVRIAKTTNMGLTDWVNIDTGANLFADTKSDAVKKLSEPFQPPPPDTTPPTSTAPRGEALKTGAVPGRRGETLKTAPKPRAEAPSIFTEVTLAPTRPSAFAALTGARTGGRAAIAAANVEAVLDKFTAGGTSKTPRQSREAVAARREAERTAPTAAQTRGAGLAPEQARARAKAEAGAQAVSEAELLDAELKGYIDDLADPELVADERDQALFGAMAIAKGRTPKGLKDTDPELAAAYRARLQRAKEYVSALPVTDQTYAEELWSKYKGAGSVPEMQAAGEALETLVGGSTAVHTLNTMLDVFAASRTSSAELPPGFNTAFRETAVAVKALGDEGRAALRGDVPLLAYVNDQNQPNVQKGKLTARGSFSLANWNTIEGVVDLDGKPITRIAPGRVQLLVRNFVTKLARPPKVTVARNQADLKAKDPVLYARAVAARTQGDFDAARAMGYSFGDGQVIVFTDRIATEQQLNFVLAHEALGHYGLRAIMPGPKFDALMELIYGGDSRTQRAVDAAMSVNPNISRAEAVEEYLSDYAAVLDTSIVARVWNGIKGFLNKLGIKTGDEMTRYLLDQARRYARTKAGATFDAEYVGSRLHAVESLGDTGRFSTAPALRDVNTAAGLLRDEIGALPMRVEEGWAYLKGQGVNSTTTWDEFKSKFLSLANFRARQNPGLARLEELIDETRNISMSLKVSYNERLRDVLNRAIAGEIGGISDKQTGTINQMLYAGQRAAVAQTRAAGDLGNVPLFTMVDGRLTKNTPEIKRLRAIGHRSRAEMRDGFEYDVTFDEAGQTVTKKEKFAGIKGLTENSIEWKGYTKIREAMDDIELELLKARYEGALQERDLAFRQIAATVPEGELSADERAAMTTLSQTYGNLYTSNITQDVTGRAMLDVDFQTYANDILRTANSALIGKESDRFDALRALLVEDRVFLKKDGSERRTLSAVMKPQMADDLIAQLQAFKARAKLGENRYVVQDKIKQIILSDIASKDADKYTKRTIATGYTPILRDGRFQMRVEAYVGGKIVRLQDSYREQLVYSQFDSASESMEAVQKTNNLFGDTEFEVMAYDQDAGEYRLQKVRLRAVSERALDAIAAPPELNLNEFIRGLRQFDVTLTPEKMEDVVVALTRQNSNARNRLERSFTPGAEMDGVMATMRHIESRASTVAKVMMRPRLAELMDRSMESTNRLWNGDAKALQDLKNRAASLAANPTARKEEIADAQRAYEQYAYMYNETNPGGGKPRRANQFYNEAANTVSFLDGNKNVDESDFGSGPMVSRIRAATSMMQLGGSVATGALNLLSLVTNGVPYLSSYNPKTGFGGGFAVGNVVSAMSMAGKQVGAPGVTSREANTAEFYDKVSTDKALQTKYGINAREAAFIAQEIRDGAMIPAQSNALVGTARGRTTSGFAQKFLDGWMWTFNVTEQASRRTLGLASYRLEFARKIAAGSSEADADAAARTFAVKALQYTMGEYSVLNRPPAWRSGIQSFMYMYKVFPTTSVQMFMNLSRNGKIGMIAGIVLLSGISGLPFAEDLEDLADTLAQRLRITGWQGARFETAKFIDNILPGMSPALLKGFVNEYVPADIAGRTSLGNLLPGTDILLAGSDPARGLGEIFGPAPSMLIGTAGFAADLLSLPFSSTTSIEDVAREAPITMLRALGDTSAYLQTGAVVDRRGYVVSDQMTAGTVLARALGFYPAVAAKQYEMIRSAKRMTDYQREIATGFRSAWIKATMRGDRDRAREIEAAVADWNAASKGTAMEVRDFVKNSRRALKEAQRPAMERTLRSAPDAAERDLRNLVDLLMSN